MLMRPAAGSSALRRRRIALIAAAAVVLLAVGVGIAVATIHPLKTVTLPASDADFPNPERGWFDAVDLIDPSAIEQAQRDGVTVLRTYIRLDADRDRAIPDSVLADLDRGFAAVRAARMKVVVRVAYNASDDGADAPLDRIRQHAGQLRPVLAKDADVILSFEAGFIGAYGEWHDSTNGLDTASAKAAVLRTILAAFPASRDVALRYPADIRALLPQQATARTAYGGSPAARVGSHLDCFLSSDPDDRGTWGVSPGSTVARDKALVASLGRFTVVGGETCGVSPRTTCPTALRELADLHFTYLNRQFDPSALAALSKGGCAEEIGRRLGYRLAVSSLAFSPHADVGGTLQLRLAIRNAGFAHVVNARPVLLVLRRGREEATVRLRTDVRTWAAGATTTVDETVRLPASVTKGSWSLGLRLPDAADALREAPAFSIRFANAGTWDPATGTNALRATVSVG